MGVPEHKSVSSQFYDIVADFQKDREREIVFKIANNVELQRTVELVLLNPNIEKPVVDETRESLVMLFADEYTIHPSVSDRALAMCEWIVENQSKDKQYGQA